MPAFGILVGGSLNWATLESIVDAAGVAYRRRFLIEKYPQLASEELPVMDVDVDADDADEMISVLDELEEATGLDLDLE